MAKSNKDWAKAAIVATLWSVVYISWLFFFLRANWNFNPVRTIHWQYLHFQWLSGWMISTPREWVFVITMCFAIPLWILGFYFFYTAYYKKVWVGIVGFFAGIFAVKTVKKKKSSSRAKDGPFPMPKATKRKSYKETRPPALRHSPSQIADQEARQAATHKENQAKTEEKSFGGGSPHPGVIGSALTMNNVSKTEAKQPSPFANNSMSGGGGRTSSGGGSKTSKAILETPEESSVPETLKKAKYDVIERQKIGQNMFTYVGIGPQSVMICLIDDSKGDWLADEEMFGAEPPLWFSESSHKTSPAYVVLRTAEHLKSVYNTMPETRHLDVYAFLVFTEGKIINADDMMETWRRQSVSVCRARNGQPMTLPELEPILPENDRGSLSEDLKKKVFEGFEKMTVRI